MNAAALQTKPECFLLPSTKRLKQLIRQHGSVWTVINGPSRVWCFEHERAYFIESEDATHRRWVRVSDVQFL